MKRNSKQYFSCIEPGLSVFILFCFSFAPVFGQIDHWETAIFEGDSWHYEIPAAAVDPAWNTVGFDDASWLTGPGGFGYGDGDDNTILPAGTVSCYQRITFNVVDKTAFDAAVLTIDYDDSFVAYLNGVEIARDMITSAGQPAWNQLADGLHEAQIYQGIYPAQYTLDQEFLNTYLNNGVNVLSIQTHNEAVSSSDMTSRAFFHFGVNSTATYYTAAPSWFIPPVILSVTNLPIIVINTEGGASIPDTPKIDAEMGIIYNGEGALNSISDPFNEFHGNIGIEIRGSSSATFPKKGYGLETRKPDGSNLNATIFDWPADNDWVLHAPYSDKSLIRNVLTYHYGNELGDYAPRTKLVELVLNGDYQGVYVFTEKIKQNPGRVDIAKLNYEDTDPMQISGGYIIKVDKTTGGGVIAWTSPYPQAAPATGPIQYQLHDPGIDTINPLQEAYIQDYVTQFEDALASPVYDDPVLGYKPFIDLYSFIDFMIMNEVSKNVDGYRISTYLHKQRDSEGGKLVAGPLWDFNLGWGNANYCQGGLTSGWEIFFNNVCGGSGGLNNPFWYNVMVTDEDFTHALNCRWWELREGVLHTDSVLAYIDSLADYLSDAADRNFNRWQTLGTYVWPNNFIGATYAEEIGYLKSWATDRLDWMDNNMFGSCPDLGIQNNSSDIDAMVYPNPAHTDLVIELKEQLTQGELEIYDMTGKLVYSETCNSTKLTIQPGLAAGIYQLRLLSGKNQVFSQKIVFK